MALQRTALRTLLAGELPLERVGPQLRRTARQALHSGQDARLLSVARTVVGELLRRGDLLRVVVEAEPASEAPLGPFYLIRGTSRLVDLSPLGSETANFTLPPALLPPPLPVPPPAGTVTRSGLPDFAGMLGAMEEAQDLDIGDPQSGDKSVILGGIVRLLAKFTPQLRLFILLDEQEVVAEAQPGIFQLTAAETAQSWLALRQAGHSAWIPTPGELPRHILASTTGEPDGPFPVSAGVAVPIWEPGPGSERTTGQEAGLLFVLTRDELGREALLRLADRVASFVSRRWQHQREVNQRIHTDSLTGVFNRAFFDSRFTLELERARRSSVPLTLVIVDLDHFKQINDRLGHPLGDRTLQMVARRLQEELRRIDLICRIGGEEFALILPDTGQEAGQDVVGRLLDAPFVEEVVHEDKDVELQVTFSCGAVTFPGAGADAFELYRKADAMLYLSKDLGRNQCHFWNSRGDHVRILPAPSSA